MDTQDGWFSVHCAFWFNQPVKAHKNTHQTFENIAPIYPSGENIIEKFHINGKRFSLSLFQFVWNFTGENAFSSKTFSSFNVCCLCHLLAFFLIKNTSVLFFMLNFFSILFKTNIFIQKLYYMTATYKHIEFEPKNMKFGHKLTFCKDTRAIRYFDRHIFVPFEHSMCWQNIRHQMCRAINKNFNLLLCLYAYWRCHRF